MKCPICKKESNSKYRPFCSLRCADIDLGRWFDGSYAIPLDNGEEIDFENEEKLDAKI